MYLVGKERQYHDRKRYTLNAMYSIHTALKHDTVVCYVRIKLTLPCRLLQTRSHPITNFLPNSRETRRNLTRGSASFIGNLFLPSLPLPDTRNAIHPHADLRRDCVVLKWVSPYGAG